MGTFETVVPDRTGTHAPFHMRPRFNAIVWLSLLPGLVLLGLFFLLPLIRLAAVSLTDKFPDPTVPFTLENYVRLFTTAFHLRGFGISLQISAIVTLLTLLTGYPVAYYLVRSQSRWKGLIFVAIVSPLLISLVVRSLGWLILLGRQGIINQFLIQLGIIQEPIQFIYTFGAVVVGEVHVLLPFMVLSITSVLSQVPRSLEDAADLLGAVPWKRFLNVTLPLSLPGVIAGSVLVFALTMGSYVTPQMLGGGRVGVVTLDIYDRMLIIFDWPLGAALAVVLMAITLVMASSIGLLQRRLGGTIAGL